MKNIEQLTTVHYNILHPGIHGDATWQNPSNQHPCKPGTTPMAPKYLDEIDPCHQENMCCHTTNTTLELLEERKKELKVSTWSQNSKCDWASMGCVWKMTIHGGLIWEQLLSLQTWHMSSLGCSFCVGCGTESCGLQGGVSMDWSGSGMSNYLGSGVFGGGAHALSSSWLLTSRLSSFCGVAGHTVLLSGSVVAMKGICFGRSKNINTNAGIQHFPVQYCAVGIWSMLFTSTLVVLNVANQYTVYHIYFCLSLFLALSHLESFTNKVC